MQLGGWALQELRRWRITPTRLLLALAPLVATAMCLTVYATRTVRDLPVAVVDLDRSNLSRILIRDLDATPQMRVIPFADLEAVHRAFRAGDIRAAAILPSGLDLAVRRGQTAKVVFWRDATNPLTANQLYSAMAAVVATEGARLVAARLAQSGLPLAQAKELALPLRTDPRPFANPSFDYLTNFAPGLFPMFLQMGLMLAAGSMLPRGWKHNHTPLQELAGRSLPWLGLYFAFAVVFYQAVMPALGAAPTPLAATLALVALLLVASLACGAVFGRYIQSPVKAGQFLLAFNTPAFPLSGYTFPEWAMPPLLSTLTRPLPFSLFVDAYRGLAGWATQRPIIGWLGLAAWALVSVLLLALPGKKGGEEVERVSRSKIVGGTFAHAFHREFLRLTRTPGLATLFLAAPVLYLALYGAMYVGKEEKRLPLAVVGGQASSLARELSTALAAHPQLQVIPMPASEARQALQRSQVRGILEIPTDLDLRLRRRQATALPLLFVADRFLPANDLQRSIGEVLSNRGGLERVLFLESKGQNPSSARSRATALALDDRPLGNPHETYGDFMLPSLGILILHQLCLVGSAFASAASSGAHRLKDFVARTLLFTIWYGLWLMVWVVVVLPLLSVPIDPHIVPLLILGGLGLVAASLLGSLLGVLIGEPGVAAQLLAFTSYPFFFASGASWPSELFPTAIRLFGKLVPLSPWITAGNRAIRLGAQVRDVAPQLLHLGLLIGAWSLGLWILCRHRNGRQGAAPSEAFQNRPAHSTKA